MDVINRISYFKEKWDMTSMMIHASMLVFEHPVIRKNSVISASLLNEFTRTIKILNLNPEKINGF